MGTICMHGAYRVQKSMSGPLELELQVVVSHLTLNSSHLEEQSVSALNC